MNLRGNDCCAKNSDIWGGRQGRPINLREKSTRVYLCPMLKTRLAALSILLVASGISWWVYSSHIQETRPFKLGLDLSGGTHLVFTADTSRLEKADIEDSMESLRDTIERRVNLFGVAEPIVYREKGSVLAGESDERLVVELPGVTDTQKAVAMIGETPVLEFRLQPKNATSSDPATFIPTPLTGRYLSRAQLEFTSEQGKLANQPVVSLVFNAEGADLFENITRENTGQMLGIFLDGQHISAPVISEPISGGSAVISGRFTPDEARELVRDLNFGALPVPISLISTETVGGTLGAHAVTRGVMAGVYGIAAVILFMMVWYRLPGVIAGVALLVYVACMLALFQIIPVTLTAAGIAAFIISIGMAVDANVLIFERTKEEIAAGKSTREAIHDGFARAWMSIRDSNISSMITAAILFWFGTSLVQGFALVFGIGVLVSMLTAITVSRVLLLSVGIDRRDTLARVLFGSGFLM